MTTERIGTIDIGAGGRVQLGGRYQLRELSQSVDLGSVATITAENEDMTITGVEVGDVVLAVNPAEGLVANILVAALGPVATQNVVRFRVVNPTAGAIDAAAVVFSVLVLRATP